MIYHNQERLEFFTNLQQQCVAILGRHIDWRGSRYDSSNYRERSFSVHSDLDKLELMVASFCLLGITVHRYGVDFTDTSTVRGTLSLIMDRDSIAAYISAYHAN